MGFTVGILVYQIGTFLTTGSFGAGFLPGMIFVAAFCGILAALIRKTDTELAAAPGSRK